MMEIIFDSQYRSIVIFLIIIALAGVGVLILHWRWKKKMEELKKYDSPFMPRNTQGRPDDWGSLDHAKKEKM